MAVRAEQHVARPAETLEVEVVRDAVPRTRVERPVARGPTAKVRVVLGVLVVELQRVVIDVGEGRNSNAVDAEPLELQARHGAGRVFEEDLVDAQLDLLRRAAGEVSVDDLLRERARGSHERSVVPGRRLLRSARRRPLRPPRRDGAAGPAAGRGSRGRRARHRSHRVRCRPCRRRGRRRARRPIARRAGLARQLRIAAPAFAPAGVTLGVAYAAVIVALDRGR